MKAISSLENPSMIMQMRSGLLSLLVAFKKNRMCSMYRRIPAIAEMINNHLEGGILPCHSSNWSAKRMQPAK